VQVTFSYVPADVSGRSGRMNYLGSTGRFKITCSGAYTIAGDDSGVLTLTQANGSCQAGSLACKGGAATITLTPAG
jgi:hypothetical protein